MSLEEKIAQTWEGGIGAFEEAFRKDRLGAYREMVGKAAAAFGPDGAANCAHLYWDRLYKDEQRHIALSFIAEACRYETLFKRPVDTKLYL